MIPTLPLLHQAFAKLNLAYFSGELPPIAIKLSRARSRLGSFMVAYRKTAGGTIAVTSRHIAISNQFDREEIEIENVLLHEMIHYCLHLRGVTGETGHGPSFRHLQEQVNSRGLHHVSVSVKTRPGETIPRHTRRAVILSTMTDGTKGITVCSETRVTWLLAIFRKWDKVRESKTYISTDPFFNQFPTVRTPKIFPIAEEEYRHLFQL